MSFIREALYIWSLQEKILLPTYPPTIDKICYNIENNLTCKNITLERLVYILKTENLVPTLEVNIKVYWHDERFRAEKKQNKNFLSNISLLAYNECLLSEVICSIAHNHNIPSCNICMYVQTKYGLATISPAERLSQIFSDNKYDLIMFVLDKYSEAFKNLETNNFKYKSSLYEGDLFYKIN